jgi:excisionase family DNA binding protein
MTAARSSKHGMMMATFADNVFKIAPVSHTSEWMTPLEAARYLHVDRRTILHWARTGSIKGHKLSGTLRVTWRFLRSDLDAKLTSPSVALANGRIQ